MTRQEELQILREQELRRQGFDYCCDNIYDYGYYNNGIDYYRRYR